MSTSWNSTAAWFEMLEDRRLMSVTDGTADVTFLSPEAGKGDRLGVSLASSVR